MEEELSMDNILEAADIDNLFMDIEDSSSEEESGSEEPKEDKKTEETTEIDSDTLFDNQSESVGSEENNKETEDTTSTEDGSSPNNFYSSIAKALKEEGIFPDLDESAYTKVKEAEDFRDLIEQQIQAGLDEKQKRIDEALNVGVEPSEIQKYEGTLNFLNNISEEALIAEDAQGEDLRKRLIVQDLMNRNYSKERIQREIKKSFDSGSDIEDAREALQGNKEFFQDNYNKIIKEAKEAAAQEEQSRKEQAEKLKSSILKDDKVFGELQVDKITRQKVFDNITKPVYRDPDTGNYYTAIQKYEMDNRTDFLKNVSLIFTLTDGFKNLDGLVKGKVKKEVKKGLRELESTLNNTARNSDGSLNFASGTNDKDSYFNGLSLDI